MRKLTQAEFMKKVEDMSLPYSFGGVEYKGNAEKITVICPTHGQFITTPNKIFNGYGCTACWTARRGKSLRTPFNEFIETATKKHGGVYTYDEQGWVGGNTLLKIYCTKHKTHFMQKASTHKIGQTGCRQCESEKISTALATPQEAYMQQCKVVHGDTYDLSQVAYKKSTSKITVVCRKHGEFYPQAGNFINNKSGCPMCAHDKTGERSRHTFESYLSRFRLVHGDKFTYHGISSEEGTTIVLVECPVHGRFEQNVQDHVKGIGCIKCSFKVWDQETFLSSAKEVHGDTYDYSKTVYVKALEKVIITCRTHGDFLQAPNYHINAKHGCRKCSDSGPSKGQIEVFNFLSDFTECVMDYRFNGRKELDVHMPKLNLAVEFNGLIWHSTRFSRSLNHLAEKSKMALLAGIRVLHIYDDEWELKENAVKQVLLQALGQSTRVFARKTSFVEVPQVTADTFLETNHLRGKTYGKCLNFGLIDGEGNLVALMAFSRVVSDRGAKPLEGHYELRRYAAACAVVGGPSKIFKGFLKSVQGVKEVLTYSENRLFTGEMYKVLGFSHISDVPPDYWYVSPNSKNRYSKSKFRRAALPKILGEQFDPALSEVENCKNAGWYRIFDCGKKKWVFSAK